MKKIISAVLAVLFIFSATAAAIPAAAADDGLQFVLTNASGVQDGEFTVDLVIKNNPGIYSFLFCLYYDSDTFILRDTKLSDSFAAVGDFTETQDNVEWDAEPGYVTPKERISTNFPLYGASADNKYTKILMFEATALDNFTTEGTVLTFTFQVEGIAKNGTYEIGLIPDTECIINVAPDYVPFTWTNALVSVGNDSTTPDETAETKATDVTVDPSDVTTKAPDTTNAPVDTFVGEDGKVYYRNEQGEKEEYNPDDFKTPEDVTPDSAAPEGTAAADIEEEKSEELKAENKKNTVILIIIIAVVLVLIGVAGLLYAFVLRAKKETESISDENSSENKE